MNVADQIRRAARRFADMPAAISGSERRSFREIEDRSNRIANALLQKGLTKGARVMTLLQNSIRCIEIDFALAKAGLIRVSMNPMSRVREIIHVMADSEAEVLIYDATFTDLVIEALEQLGQRMTCIAVGDGEAAAANEDGFRELPTSYEELIAGAEPTPPECPCRSEDLYCLFYTSGTTGRPKGVMLSHRSMLQVAFNLIMEVGPQRPGEKILLMQPMSHGAGFFVLPWFMKGGVSVIMPRFDPIEALEIARNLEIETVKLVPTMMQRILNCDSSISRCDLPRLRQIIYGASPMPIEVLRAGIERFGPTYTQIYGQSEAPVTISILSSSDHHTNGDGVSRLASAGAPWPTVQVRIVDDQGCDVPAGTAGEILVSAPQVMSGYWKLPELTEATLKDGWLHTRDLGRLDDEGFLYLLGRLDEMIISGGQNIAPREVEDVLYQHPAVREAAVLGEPDPEWGSAVVAYVVLDREITEAELFHFAKAEIGFKGPKRVYRVMELPKNANGKIQKSALMPSIALPWKMGAA